MSNMALYLSNMALYLSKMALYLSKMALYLSNMALYLSKMSINPVTLTHLHSTDSFLIFPESLKFGGTRVEISQVRRVLLFTNKLYLKHPLSCFIIYLNVCLGSLSCSIL